MNFATVPVACICGCDGASRAEQTGAAAPAALLGAIRPPRALLQTIPRAWPGLVGVNVTRSLLYGAVNMPAPRSLIVYYPARPPLSRNNSVISSLTRERTYSQGNSEGRYLLVRTEAFPTNDLDAPWRAIKVNLERFKSFARNTATSGVRVSRSCTLVRKSVTEHVPTRVSERAIYRTEQKDESVTSGFWRLVGLIFDPTRTATGYGRGQE
ncbi:hypothetical protein J6590_051552 [Homalodisca vitripennis]|nr:hypothetical protein J6590_051552 [Homalodisca vitripennis]